MKPRTATEHYEEFAEEYDSLSKKHEWYSPEILFGLLFEFVKKNESILDLGIGTGQSAIPFHKIGMDIFGLDSSEKMLEKCKQKGITQELKKFDLNQAPLPYENNFFDHIISNGVFYFFRDLEPFFKEAKRILKKEGTFSFTVENLKKGYEEEYVNKDNDQISERLIEKAGVKVCRHSQEYIENLIKIYGFKILKKLEYFAYNSPTKNKDIYFKAYILRKK